MTVTTLYRSFPLQILKSDKEILLKAWEFTFLYYFYFYLFLNFDIMLLFFQLDLESIVAGKAAIGNMLGGIGYFYGQSKISLPRDSNVSNWSDYL